MENLATIPRNTGGRRRLAFDSTVRRKARHPVDMHGDNYLPLNGVLFDHSMLTSAAFQRCESYREDRMFCIHQRSSLVGENAVCGGMVTVIGTKCSKYAHPVERLGGMHSLDTLQLRTSVG